MQEPEETKPTEILPAPQVPPPSILTKEGERILLPERDKPLPPGWRKATPEDLKAMRPQLEAKAKEIRARERRQAVIRKFSYDPMRKPWLEAGMEICCPNCKKHIAYVVKRLLFDTVITSEHFQGPGIKPGAPMKCFDCGMPWCLPEDNFRMHTRLGWFPPSI